MSKRKPLTAPDLPINTRIDAVICFVLGVEPDRIHDDAHFVNDLDSDSLDCVEMLMAMETEFNIDIHDDDAEQVDTVGKLKEYIEQALRAKAA